MMHDHNLATLQARAEQFFRELEREHYLEGSGLKEDADTTAVYERYPDLASPSVLEWLQEEIAKSGEVGERKGGGVLRQKLLMFLEMGFQTCLGNADRTIDDAILRRESSGVVRIPGTQVDLGFRSAVVALVNEHERSRRSALSSAVNQFTDEELNPLFRQSYHLVTQAVQTLGYRSYRDLAMGVTPFDLLELHAMMEGFLKETELMYRETLAWFVKQRLGIELGDVRKHDLSHLSRGSEFDRFFPAEEMSARVLGFVRKMGIDPTVGGRVRLDLDDRPRKSPRAFCSPVQIPDEVHLVIRPAGGVDDYEALLHELGHALHFGHMRAGLDWEYRRLGDNSVTEGFAITFDHLRQNPVWLSRIMDWQDTLYFRQHAAFVQLMMLRRYAAKLSYELVLHDGKGLEGKEEVYRRFLSDATLAAYPPEQYLADVDPFFYCARYLRAWMVESMLSRYLVENFDTDWFLNPRAGEFLKELWARGQPFRAEEMMRDLAYPRLTMEFITLQIESLLGTSA